MGSKRHYDADRWRFSSVVAALDRLLLGASASLIFGVATPARADDAQLWASTRVTAKVASRILVSNETVYRTSKARGDYDFVDHVQAGYQFDRHITFWIGYTHQTGMNRGRRSFTEQRLRQQVNIENILKLGPARFGGRLRLEERRRGIQMGTGWRLRPQEKATLPLMGKINLSISHEDFINLNQTAFQSVAGEDRMRNAISLTAPLNRHLSLEVGYLQQHFFGPASSNADANVATVLLSGSF